MFDAILSANEWNRLHRKQARCLTDSNPLPRTVSLKISLNPTDLLCADDLWWSRSSRQDDIVTGFWSRRRSVSTKKSEIVRDRDIADLG